MIECMYASIDAVIGSSPYFIAQCYSICLLSLSCIYQPSIVVLARMHHKPNPEIVKLIEKAETDDASRELATYNQIVKLGIQDGIVALDRFYEWYRVAVSRFNRHGLIATGCEAADIFESIDGLGFDPSLIKDATAFEEGPHKPNIEAFMEKVAADQMLPRYDAKNLEISSVACSHFNIAIGQACQGMPHGNERFTVDGCLNVAKMKQAEPDMSEVLDKKGCRWTVWLYPAAELYPGLPQLAQRAINAKMQTTSGINNFELFSRASSQVQNPSIQAKADPKAFVMKQLAKLKSTSSVSELNDIVMTARKYSSIGLGPFTRHVSAMKRKGRSVPAMVWNTLANTKFDHNELCPHFVQSVLMACASCPDGVINGKDLKVAMTKKKQDMMHIEELIKASLDIPKDMKLDRAIETKEVNVFRTSLILKFLDKGAAAMNNAPYYQIGKTYFEACSSASTITIASPFEKFRGVESAVRDNRGSACDGSHDDDRRSHAHVDERLDLDNMVVEYDESGKVENYVKNVLASKGYVCGAYTEKKKDKDGTVLENICDCIYI